MAFHSLNTENKRFQCEDYFDYCEGPFTISIQALFNTLPLESFSFERALAYIAWCLAFVACVLMVASIFLKLWTCTLFRRNTSVYTLYKHLCFRPQLTMNDAISGFFWAASSLALNYRISTGECRKRAVYLTPPTLTNIINRKMEHMIAQAPHI